MRSRHQRPDHMHLRRAATVFTAALAAGISSVPTIASSEDWSSSISGGKAVVDADRRKITVCDHDSNDGIRVKAEFSTDNPIDPTVYVVEAPQGGCADDRTYISWISMFKACSARGKNPVFSGTATNRSGLDPAEPEEPSLPSLTSS
ncbi:hypothetical protein HII36_09595 [Nonomuraea sp. NN258]|uniref:hypothetical protein n=1 Tax=Nonomuraea antri TaxID=2730852 RepID=UPI001569F538|nr:hypothetical protein [Nonomuraea antri]NRQ32089.1 hypothetical protein [Nonomuraea antri]